MPSQDPKVLRGQALRNARDIAGVTAQELCDLASRYGFKLSRAAIYAYESGRVLLPHRRAVPLAHALGIDLRDLLPDISQGQVSTVGQNVVTRCSVEDAIFAALEEMDIALTRIKVLLQSQRTEALNQKHEASPNNGVAIGGGGTSYDCELLF